MSNLSLPKAISEQLSQALVKVYGDEVAVSQAARYHNAIQRFYELYGSGPIHIFRTPGRVNLIGEHTDYNHGYVMPAALDKDLLLLARPRADQHIRLSNIEPAFTPIEFTLAEKIPQAESGSWSNYARGAGQVFYQHLATHGHELQGLDGLVASDTEAGIPKGAGLSSSTALTVATAVALLDQSQQTISPSQMAQLCSDAEWYVGTRGGIMDQFATLFARRGHALFLDCRPNQPGDNHRDYHGDYHFEHIPLPEDYQLLVVDSGVHHENARNEFNQRVAACRAGVALLKSAYPTITHLRDVQEVDWQLLENELPEQITLDTLGNQGIDLGDIPGLNPTTMLLPTSAHGMIMGLAAQKSKSSSEQRIKLRALLVRVSQARAGGDVSLPLSTKNL